MNSSDKYSSVTTLRNSAEQPYSSGRKPLRPVPFAGLIKPAAAALLLALLLCIFSARSGSVFAAVPAGPVLFSDDLSAEESSMSQLAGDTAASAKGSFVPIDVYSAAEDTMELAAKPEILLESYSPELARPDKSPFVLINEAPAAPDIVVGAANYQYQYGSIGWLNIPGTSINNAVMQARNNDYYLYRTETGAPSSYGCYFADYECTFGPRSALSNNTVIYGHHIDTGIGDAPNGIRFGQLFNYRNSSFAYTHPYIYFSTASEKMTWQVFAVFYVNLNSDRQVNIVRGDASSLANYGISRSMYNFGVSVGPGDKILTLYTCSYRDGSFRSGRSANIRFIVMAKLV